MSLLSQVLGKQGAIKMVMSLLKQIFGGIGKEAVTLALEAEAHEDWTGKQKFDYVKNSLIAKYKRAESWKWVLNFLIEWAVGQIQPAKVLSLPEVVK
jgi:hypothetical protein